MCTLACEESVTVVDGTSLPPPMKPAAAQLISDVGLANFRNAEAPSPEFWGFEWCSWVVVGLMEPRLLLGCEPTDRLVPLCKVPHMP